MRRFFENQIKSFLARQRSDLPAGAEALFEIFLALHETRGADGMANPQAITFVEIEAYASLMRWPLQPHHVAMIRAIDRTWLDHVRGLPSHGSPTAGAPKMSPAAFDVVFG